jgi:hypothetical protein
MDRFMALKRSLYAWNAAGVSTHNQGYMHWRLCLWRWCTAPHIEHRSRCCGCVVMASQWPKVRGLQCDAELFACEKFSMSGRSRSRSDGRVVLCRVQHSHTAAVTAAH